MNCTNCGTNLEGNESFCPVCNTPTGFQQANYQQQPYQQPYQQQPYQQPYQQTQRQPYQQICTVVQPAPTNGCAIAGFILSFFPAFNLIAFILCIVGITQAKNCNGNGKGLAIAGLILTTLIDVIAILVFVGIFAGAGALAYSGL